MALLWPEKLAKPWENESFRRAKRAGKIFGVWGPETLKHKEMMHFRRAKRAGKFWVLGSQNL